MVSVTRAARALVCAFAAFVVIAPSAGAAKDPNQVSRALRDGVTVQGITQHLLTLQDIATANGGTRASGTPGYAASRDYVVRRLQAAGLSRERPALRLRLLPQDRPRVVRREPPTTRTRRSPRARTTTSWTTPATAPRREPCRPWT